MFDFKNPPLVMAGLILGLFALGNLLESFPPILRYIFGTIAFLLFVILISGIFLNFKSFREQIAQPLIASVFTTFFMQGMLASGYLLLFSSLGNWIVLLAKCLWWFSLIGLVVYMIVFTKNFLFHFDLGNVFPSWTVLYVGIGVAGLTAPVSNQFSIGKLIVWYGILASFCVLPLVFVRLKRAPLSDMVKPNIMTICAPLSLMTAAYLRVYGLPNHYLLLTLIVLSQLLYFYMLYQLPKLLQLPFSPGFSAFTFPLVISATALKMTLTSLELGGIWQALLIIEIAIATLVVLRVLLGYILYFKTN